MIKIEVWLRDSWRLTLKTAPILLPLSLLYMAISLALGFYRPWLGVAFNLGCWGLLDALGFVLLINTLKSGPCRLGQMRLGGGQLLNVFAANLLITTLMLIGQLFCVLPGLLVGALFLFVAPLIVDRKLSLAAALKESYGKSYPQIWGLTAFLLFISLVPSTIITLFAIGAPVEYFLWQRITVSALFWGLFMGLYTPYFLAIIVVAYRDFWPEEIPAETTNILPGN